MTDQTTSSQATVDQEPPPSGWAVGLTLFAGVLMIIAGGFQAFAGLVAITEDEFYATTPNYVLQLDTTRWGWAHLLLGLIVVGAGFAVLKGKVWGRVVAIILASLSALANFAFIPYYPFWSITILALNVFVIWALTTHGRDITRK
jgi:hypothetical protein